MARRLSSTAALVLLVFSLLAVAHCRPIEADPATDAGSAVVVATGDDENGPPNPTLPAEFLRLPSHRLHRHRPCRHGLFHRHLWWARHHGAFGDDAPRWFHRHGEAPSHSHLTLSPAAEAREVKAVAEPDPDRSLPDSDQEEVRANREPSFGGAHDHEEAAHEDDGAAVRAWRKEMQRRWFHSHHHHDMRLHHHHGEEEEEHAMTRKRFRHADERDDDSDSEDEDQDEEVEELVRRFRKAIMRRRSGHGRRFHLRHAEGAEKADAAQEEGGVVSWIKDLIMNRF